MTFDVGVRRIRRWILQNGYVAIQRPLTSQLRADYDFIVWGAGSSGP